jgi:hypothetical protein
MRNNPARIPSEKPTTKNHDLQEFWFSEAEKALAFQVLSVIITP